MLVVLHVLTDFQMYDKSPKKPPIIEASTPPPPLSYASGLHKSVASGVYQDIYWSIFRKLLKHTMYNEFPGTLMYSRNTISPL